MRDQSKKKDLLTFSFICKLQLELQERFSQLKTHRPFKHVVNREAFLSLCDVSKQAFC